MAMSSDCSPESNLLKPFVVFSELGYNLVKQFTMRLELLTVRRKDFITLLKLLVNRWAGSSTSLLY